MAASATFALKAAVWFRRGRLIMVSPDSQATACPPSGRNSTYRPVQISGASSITNQRANMNRFEASCRSRINIKGPPFNGLARPPPVDQHCCRRATDFLEGAAKEDGEV